MAEAMTKEQAMTVAVAGERAALGDLLPALKRLFFTVRELEIESTNRLTANEVLRKKLEAATAASEGRALNVAMPDRQTALAVMLVIGEMDSAMTKFGALKSPHEGLGVLTEEYHELMEWVRLKEEKRVAIDGYNEAKQLAAVSIRFMLDCCRPINPVEACAVIRTGPVG